MKTARSPFSTPRQPITPSVVVSRGDRPASRRSSLGSIQDGFRVGVALHPQLVNVRPEVSSGVDNTCRSLSVAVPFITTANGIRSALVRATPSRSQGATPINRQTRYHQ